MARFRLTTAHVFGSRKLKAGSTIADTQGNAIGNDVVVGVTSASCSNGMVALDGAATTMLQASRFSGPSNTFIDGVNSID